MTPIRPLAWLLILLLAGCEPAGRYSARPKATRPTATQPAAKGPDKPAEPEPLPTYFLWDEPDPSLMESPVPIVFVHRESNLAEWNKLKQFWTLEWEPGWVGAYFGLAPPAVAGLAFARPAAATVKVKVPAGLDDPARFIPAANPPTLNKWALGRQLFLDPIVLRPASEKLTCSTCHKPGQGFTDTKFVGFRMDPPTLINSVYNARQFWDGRAGNLEEVVQRNLEDEREPPVKGPRQFHTWGGVVQRLREHAYYDRRFKQVFGARPTVDAVGKALATYLRTILVGNSVHDRAELALQERGGKALEPQDYEKALDDVSLKTLAKLDPDPPRDRAEMARDLHQGWTLFNGKARCAQCHSGRNFTDNGFHNLGIAESALARIPGKESGRFATAPPGGKDLHLIGAFKTPTLRALPRTAPYFHNGRDQVTKDVPLNNTLFLVIQWHVRSAPPNQFLDPAIRDLGLKEEEVRALVLFLLALDGDPVSEVLYR